MIQKHKIKSLVIIFIGVILIFSLMNYMQLFTVYVPSEIQHSPYIYSQVNMTLGFRDNSIIQYHTYLVGIENSGNGTFILINLRALNFSVDMLINWTAYILINNSVRVFTNANFYYFNTGMIANSNPSTIRFVNELVIVIKK